MSPSSSDRRLPLSSGENLAVGAFGGAMETCLQMPGKFYMSLLVSW
jgi:hypothetical protein